MATGQDIMVRAATLLQDSDHVRWPLTDLCTWINEAVRAIILAKPSASSVTMPLQLQVGTLQKLPTDGAPRPLALLRVVRNLASLEDDPPVGGRAITLTNGAALDAQEPNWHDPKVVPFKPVVRQFATHTDDPLTFYVYPGNSGDGIVEAVVSVLPADLVATGDVANENSYAAEIGLPPIYDGPILDYVMYRAQSKDDTGANVSRAAIHYQQFATAIGIKIQTESAYSAARQATRT